MSDLFPGSDLKVLYRVEYLEDGNTIAIVAREICPHTSRCKCTRGYKVLAQGLTLDDVLDLYTDISAEIINDVVRWELRKLAPAEVTVASTG
jgi:hypothetical protein